MKKFKIAIFASGSGTNAERLFFHFKGHEQIEIALLLSNNSNAYVLERAKVASVPSKAFSRDQFKQSAEVLQWLDEYEITHLVLAGFIWLIPQIIIDSYSNRIINIHPALLPKFGGKGMYGHKVHEAVKAAMEKETGITIHLVNEHYDDGRILFQAATRVMPEDSSKKIAEKVHALEYAHYPRVVENWVLENS